MTIFAAVLQWSLPLAYETTTTQPAPRVGQRFPPRSTTPTTLLKQTQKCPTTTPRIAQPSPPGAHLNDVHTQETLPTLRQAYAPQRPGYCYPLHEEIYKNFLRHPCSTREMLSGSLPFSSLPLLFQLSRLFSLNCFFFISATAATKPCSRATFPPRASSLRRPCRLRFPRRTVSTRHLIAALTGLLVVVVAAAPAPASSNTRRWPPRRASRGTTRAGRRPCRPA